MQTNPMNVEHITFQKTGQTWVKTIVNYAYIWFMCHILLFWLLYFHIHIWCYIVNFAFLGKLLADHKQWILISNANAGLIKSSRVIPLCSPVSQSSSSIAVGTVIIHPAIRTFQNRSKNLLVWPTKHQPRKGGGRFFKKNRGVNIS